MTDQTSNPYRRTLSGSVGAGMGSLFRPGSRKYYILEHKVSSKYHRAGESQEIIVDNIELGRDARCQVRFDESFKTVSRRHAAIVRDGDGWKLVQLSQTNTTLLNGRPVKTEWYLQSGDEIQLSVNGPKLGFIVPTGRKATVGSIGLTRRLSLFRQQALRPYKTAIAALAAVLLICAGAGGFVIFRQHRQIQDNSKLLAEARAANEKNAKLIAEQRKIIGNQGGLLDSLQKRIPAEATMPEHKPLDFDALEPGRNKVNAAVGLSAVTTAFNVGAKAILTPTNSGRSARLVSNFRPVLPIQAVTPNEWAVRKMTIYWGVEPILSGRSVGSIAYVVDNAVVEAKMTGIVKEGDLVVVTAGDPAIPVKLRDSEVSTNVVYVSQVM